VSTFVENSPDPFIWTDETWGQALRCGPLLEVAPHLFTTRAVGLANSEDDDPGWERVAASIGVAPGDLVRLRQVHGRAAVVLRRNASGHPPRPPGASRARPEADIALTDDPDVALLVQVADCVPILLCDPKSGAVAAAHAGWRGTAANVAGTAVSAMAAAFGTRARDIVAAIGPSIGPCCYGVGTEVRDAFAAAGFAGEASRAWFFDPNDETRPGPAHTAGTGTAAAGYLDLWGANTDQLTAAGILRHNLHVAALCTAANRDRFYSYRAEGKGTGRMAAVITSARLGSGPVRRQDPRDAVTVGRPRERWRVALDRARIAQAGRGDPETGALAKSFSAQGGAVTPSATGRCPPRVTGYRRCPSPPRPSRGSQVGRPRR
jgi:polyphenol oxidase